jgi:effector-binding domain-containing protein
MQQRVDEELAQLARVRFHIRQIEMEAYMSKLDVRIKKVEPMRALTFRRVFPTHAEIEQVGLELQKALRVHRVGTLEPWLALVYADEYSQHNVDMEFVYPVNDAHTGDLPLETGVVMTLREIPGIAEAATYIYEGNPDDVNEVLVDLQRWVAANGYKLSGMIRLVALRGPKERLPANEWLTEVQHPLEKA